MINSNSMTTKLPMIDFTNTAKRLLQIYITYKLQNYKDPKCAEQAQTHGAKLESSQQSLSHLSCDFR